MPSDARLALVTGAGSGIGRACALALGKRGFALAVVDLDEGSARETASQIPGAKAYRADVSNAAQVEAAVGAAVADLGPLEVLVNNAGILDGYFNVDEMDHAVWRKVIDVDLTSVFLMSKRALREMLPRGRGRIINMASVAGLNGTGGGAAYIAAKHGVVGLTRQMAVTYGARGITVNCVCPGPIDTGMTSSISSEDKSTYARRRVPLRRYGIAEEVAHMTLNLCLPASSFVNGAIIPVDGGMSIRHT
jgi:3-oxoacyl-[acyl-carrier protein] reductase